jgi:glycosyltransferase involved in cell wall biosynthesis
MTVDPHSQERVSKFVVVCIPAYNEEKSIGEIVSKAQSYATEVIVYNDGSTDSTAEIATTAGATVISNSRNKGYGKALSELFKSALMRNADIMVTLDSDGQHNAEEIPLLLEPLLTNKADIAIGSRFLNQEDIKHIPAYRSLGIKAITKMARVACYENITDSQSGFRAYNLNALSKLRLYEDGMAISTEILLKASQQNLRIVEVPIKVKYFKDSSTHNPLSHGASVMAHLLRHISFKRPLLFYGVPGVVLLVISSLFIYNALELFSNTRYVSTNMVIISLGISIMGILLLSTSAIIYTLVSLFRGHLGDI